MGGRNLHASVARMPYYSKLFAENDARQIAKYDAKSKANGKLSREKWNAVAEEVLQDPEPVNVWQLLLNSHSVRPYTEAQKAREGCVSGWVAVEGRNVVFIGHAVPVDGDVLHTGYMVLFTDGPTAVAASEADEVDMEGVTALTSFTDMQATIYNALLQPVCKLLACEEMVTTMLATDLDVLAYVMRRLQFTREALINLEPQSELYKLAFEWASTRIKIHFNEGIGIQRAKRLPAGSDEFKEASRKVYEMQEQACKEAAEKSGLIIRED